MRVLYRLRPAPFQWWGVRANTPHPDRSQRRCPGATTDSARRSTSSMRCENTAIAPSSEHNCPRLRPDHRQRRSWPQDYLSKGGCTLKGLKERVRDLQQAHRVRQDVLRRAFCTRQAPRVRLLTRSGRGRPEYMRLAHGFQETLSSRPYPLRTAPPQPAAAGVSQLQPLPQAAGPAALAAAEVPPQASAPVCLRRFRAGRRAAARGCGTPSLPHVADCRERLLRVAFAKPRPRRRFATAAPRRMGICGVCVPAAPELADPLNSSHSRLTQTGTPDQIPRTGGWEAHAAHAIPAGSRDCHREDPHLPLARQPAGRPRRNTSDWVHGNAKHARCGGWERWRWRWRRALHARCDGG